MPLRDKNYWKMTVEKLWIIIFLLIAIYLLIFSPYGMVKIIRLKLQIYRMQQEISILKAKEALLKYEVKLLDQDTSYINKIAREEFGIGK
jgi:cell division protein FtsB